MMWISWRILASCTSLASMIALLSSHMVCILLTVVISFSCFFSTGWTLYVVLFHHGVHVMNLLSSSVILCFVLSVSSRWFFTWCSLSITFVLLPILYSVPVSRVMRSPIRLWSSSVIILSGCFVILLLDFVVLDRCFDSIYLCDFAWCRVVVFG